jgi:hypothetical protein
MSDAMPEIERLRQRFIAEFEAGANPDPRDYLAQLEGADQRELEVLLDAYLAQAPRRAFEPAAFAASPARALVDDLEQSLAGRAGSWPVVLPRLRNAARLRRGELVRRLADSLGVAGREAKVERYYHEMEQGLLVPAGVSDRVLDALATLLDTSRDRLREAGASHAFGDSVPGGALFARRAEYGEPELAAMASAPASQAKPEERDEVDELFLGGN